MNGQRNQKTAFLISPICGFVVDAVLYKHRNCTEYIVEQHIGEVLKNIPKGKWEDDEESGPDEANDTFA